MRSAPDEAVNLIEVAYFEYNQGKCSLERQNDIKGKLKSLIINLRRFCWNKFSGERL